MLHLEKPQRSLLIILHLTFSLSKKKSPSDTTIQRKGRRKKTLTISSHQTLLNIQPFPFQAQSTATSTQRKKNLWASTLLYLPPSDRRNQLQYVFLHCFQIWVQNITFFDFFCWIGLDLILVLIPFCFRFLGSP